MAISQDDEIKAVEQAYLAQVVAAWGFMFHSAIDPTIGFTQARDKFKIDIREARMAMSSAMNALKELGRP